MGYGRCRSRVPETCIGAFGVLCLLMTLFVWNSISGIISESSHPMRTAGPPDNAVSRDLLKSHSNRSRRTARRGDLTETEEGGEQINHNLTDSGATTQASEPITYNVPEEHDFVFFDDDVSRGLPVPVANRTPVYMMGFVSVETGSEGWSSAGVLPALQMAMRDVNDRKDLLVGLELRLHVKDTRCDPGYAIQALYKHLTSDPPRLLIIGGGCSVSTVPVARAAPHFGLAQVAYSAASPELSDREVFPTFFRTAASDFAMVAPLLHLCFRFGWRHLATLYEINDLFAMTINLLHRDMQLFNISLIAANSFSTSVTEPLLDLKSKKARIIFSDSYEGPQKEVFCEAYRQGMYGSQYQWLIPGWYSEAWLQVSDTSCSLEELKEATEYAITITDVKYDVSGQRSISGEDYATYQHRYESWPSLAEYGWNQYHPLAYDAVWAAALALNATLSSLHDKINSPVSIPGQPMTSQNVTYGGASEFTELLLYHLERTEFQGVSGMVSFQDGDRVAGAEVGQIRGGRKHVVAFYDPQGDNLHYIPGEQLLWHGDGPPVSQAEFRLVTVSLSSASRAGLIGASGLGTASVTAFLVFNCRYHAHPFIKMSSPRLNSVILLGCAVTYIHALSLALDTTLVTYSNFHYVCLVREWTLPVGFTSLFGAMFVKTWRVHRIFSRQIWINKPAAQDRHLLGFLCVLLVLDLGLLTAWTLTDGVTAQYTNTSVPKERDSVVVQERAVVCHSSQALYWMGALYGIKVLLLFVGCILAYETRRITVPALNDSKYIGLSVYNVVVMSVLGVAVTLGLANDVRLALVVRALCTLLTATTTMLLVFLPKVRYVYKHPLDSSPCESRSQSSTTFSYTLKSVSKTVSRHQTSALDSNLHTDLSVVSQDQVTPKIGSQAGCAVAARKEISEVSGSETELN